MRNVKFSDYLRNYKRALEGLAKSQEKDNMYWKGAAETAQLIFEVMQEDIKQGLLK